MVSYGNLTSQRKWGESTDEVEKPPYFLLEQLRALKSTAGKALCQLRAALLLAVPACILQLKTCAAPKCIRGSSLHCEKT